MNIDQFKPATVYTIYIASTPEKVWQALTTAEFSRQYFFGFAVEMEMRVGGSFIVRAPDGSTHIDGEVLACDPPFRLSVTWNVNWPGLVEKLGQTIVSYEIAEMGDADGHGDGSSPEGAARARKACGTNSICAMRGNLCTSPSRIAGIERRAHMRPCVQGVTVTPGSVRQSLTRPLKASRNTNELR